MAAKEISRLVHIHSEKWVLSRGIPIKFQNYFRNCAKIPIYVVFRAVLYIYSSLLTARPL